LWSLAQKTVKSRKLGEQALRYNSLALA